MTFGGSWMMDARCGVVDDDMMMNGRLFLDGLEHWREEKGLFTSLQASKNRRNTCGVVVMMRVSVEGRNDSVISPESSPSTPAQTGSSIPMMFTSKVPWI
jgi:hypothetical protein